MKKYKKIDGRPGIDKLLEAADKVRVRLSKMSPEERKKLREDTDKLIRQYYQN